MEVVADPAAKVGEAGELAQEPLVGGEEVAEAPVVDVRDGPSGAPEERPLLVGDDHDGAAAERGQATAGFGYRQA